jgi:hypothetical protein
VIPEENEFDYTIFTQMKYQNSFKMYTKESKHNQELTISIISQKKNIRAKNFLHFYFYFPKKHAQRNKLSKLFKFCIFGC